MDTGILKYVGSNRPNTSTQILILSFTHSLTGHLTSLSCISLIYKTEVIIREILVITPTDLGRFSEAMWVSSGLNALYRMGAHSAVYLEASFLVRILCWIRALQVTDWDPVIQSHNLALLAMRPWPSGIYHQFFIKFMPLYFEYNLPAWIHGEYHITCLGGSM